ncbi:MAG: hypothetical protein HYW22_00335 [Candidatus Aenigmarchaeota archaeon]|nr:hypothetical protein [Candidatus Aenigmarchaeota archaeon]
MDEDRKKQIREVGERIKSHIQKAGYQVVDADEFFEGIDELYRKPSVDQVVSEELPAIVAADPTILERNGIDLTNVGERIRQLYQNNPWMVSHYSDSEGGPVGRVEWTVKVWLRHVRFFMVDSPDSYELAKDLDNLRRTLDGRWIETEQPIPNSFVAKPGAYDFSSYDGIRHLVKTELDFVKQDTVTRVAREIFEHSPDPSERARYAERAITLYFKAARDVMLNKGRQIPPYFDVLSDEYIKYLGPSREFFAQ